jgi:hypothetical protein
MRRRQQAVRSILERAHRLDVHLVSHCLGNLLARAEVSVFSIPEAKVSMFRFIVPRKHRL